jgi:hypothetical protein
MLIRLTILLIVLLITAIPAIAGLNWGGLVSGVRVESENVKDSRFDEVDHLIWQKQCDIPLPPLVAKDSGFLGNDGDKPELGVLRMKSRFYQCIRSGNTFTILKAMD